MSVASGIFSAVNGKGMVRTWQVSKTSSPKKGVASNTLGGPLRRRGVKDWTGNYSAYGGQPQVMPGSSFAFVGYTAPTSGVEGENGDTYSGTAIVDSVVINWNFETGDLISHVVNFSGDGPLTEGTGAVTDITQPDAQECIDISPELEDGTEIPNITTVALTISAENKNYVNSSTAGWNKRKRGNMDCTLTMGVHNTNFDDFVAELGDDLRLKLFVSATAFWDLKWMHFKDVSNITASREDAAITGFTANFEFNGFPDVDPLETGLIALPDETVWWGEEE
jgi:hypothetical protein